jgi:hypothetical protein
LGLDRLEALVGETKSLSSAAGLSKHSNATGCRDRCK